MNRIKYITQFVQVRSLLYNNLFIIIEFLTISYYHNICFYILSNRNSSHRTFIIFINSQNLQIYVKKLNVTLTIKK